MSKIKSKNVIDFRKEKLRNPECEEHVFLRKIFKVVCLEIESEVSCEKCSNGQRDSMGRFTVGEAFPSHFEKATGFINQQLRTKFSLH